MSLGRPELIDPNEIPKSFLHESKRRLESVSHPENLLKIIMWVSCRKREETAVE